MQITPDLLGSLLALLVSQSGAAYAADSEQTSEVGETVKVMWPLYQGCTYQPGKKVKGNCTLGGYPSYVVDAQNVAYLQLAINLAQLLNMQLVIKNTGHDFNGRSAGAGALSIWTYRFKGIYGPALKVGAGIIGSELYEAADKYGVTAIGGEGMSVGFAGGYLAGGRYSPMSPIYGMGADQILSINVVTADGQFITANQEENTNLFWALSGGGGSTYGVVTSYTVKAFPKINTSIIIFSFGTSETVTYNTFWMAIRAY
ncbi:hypothetical protein DER46DRAFT_665683 [Fusarium sp. MPI-SDFR-AT-0072]|nr:hypothetical protein DER46DRAFT_665683 [Fusarium sp. MPI-SDFR-AT-0072]